MGGWTGEKGWIYDMGKDIDRNITRQLWERLKNTFTRNDVIPVENGGTGVNNLELFYPKLVEDKYITRIEVKTLTPVNGFTIVGDTNLIIIINKKSMFFDGTIHVTRNTGITENVYLKHEIPIKGYNINNIQIAQYESTLSINDNILSLGGSFNTSNEYRMRFQNFIPII